MHKDVDNRQLIKYLKLVMREHGLSQLVIVDDGRSPDLAIHANRADFRPSRKNFIRAMPMFVPGVPLDAS